MLGIIVRFSKTKIALLSLWVFLGLSGFALFGPASKAHAAPVSCQPGGVYVIFARGSGEHFDDTRATAFKSYVLQNIKDAGMPNPAWAELGNLDGDFSISSTEYPAIDVHNGWNALPWNYGPSVETGTNELVRSLNRRVADFGPGCAKETIILAGYSQGADVIGWALERTGGGDDWSLRQDVKDRIGFVALYGDPKFDAGDWQSRQAGVTPWWVRGNSTGIGSGLTVDGKFYNYTREGVLGQRSPYIRPEFNGRFGSWCDQEDGICSASDTLFWVGSHTSAYQQSWILNSGSEVALRARDKVCELNAYSTICSQTRIGAIQNGTLSVKEGDLGQPWRSVMTSAVVSAVSGNRIGAVDTSGVLSVKAGRFNAPWVYELPNVRTFALAGNRIGALTNDGTFYVKDGSLAAPWISEMTGASAIAVSDNRIGAIVNGTLYVKEGDLGGPWVAEFGPATMAALTDSRIAVVATDGTLLAKEGSLYTPWVQELSSTTAISLSGNRIGAIAYGGNYYIKEGGLYAGWVLETSAVTGAALGNGRIGVLSNGSYIIKEGGIYAPWAPVMTGASSISAMN